MVKVTIDWMREDYFDCVEQTALMLKPEMGFAAQRAIIDNFESLDEMPSRKNLLGQIKGGGNSGAGRQ